MAGTLGGALAARGIPAVPDNLVTDVEADIEQEDRIILLTRVRLKYHVTVPRGKRAEAERAIAVHHQGCPVYKSLERGIAVEWDADITEE